MNSRRYRIARLQHEFEMTKALDIPSVIKAYRLERAHTVLVLIQEDAGGAPLAKEMAGQS